MSGMCTIPVCDMHSSNSIKYRSRRRHIATTYHCTPRPEIWSHATVYVYIWRFPEINADVIEITIAHGVILSFKHDAPFRAYDYDLFNIFTHALKKFGLPGNLQFIYYWESVSFFLQNPLIELCKNLIRGFCKRKEKKETIDQIISRD